MKNYFVFALAAIAWGCTKKSAPQETSVVRSEQTPAPNSGPTASPTPVAINLDHVAKDSKMMALAEYGLCVVYKDNTINCDYTYGGQGSSYTSVKSLPSKDFNLYSPPCVVKGDELFCRGNGKLDDFKEAGFGSAKKLLTLVEKSVCAPVGDTFVCRGDLTLNEKLKGLKDVAVTEKEHAAVCALFEAGLKCWGPYSLAGKDLALSDDLTKNAKGFVESFDDKIHILTADQKVVAFRVTQNGIYESSVVRTPLKGVNPTSAFRVNADLISAFDGNKKQLTLWRSNENAPYQTFDDVSEVTRNCYIKSKALHCLDNTNDKDFLATANPVNLIENRNQICVMSAGKLRCSGLNQSPPSLSTVDKIVGERNMFCARSGTEVKCWRNTTTRQANSVTSFSNARDIWFDQSTAKLHILDKSGDKIRICDLSSFTNDKCSDKKLPSRIAENARIAGQCIVESGRLTCPEQFWLAPKDVEQFAAGQYSVCFSNGGRVVCRNGYQRPYEHLSGKFPTQFSLDLPSPPKSIDVYRDYYPMCGVVAGGAVHCSSVWQGLSTSFESGVQEPLSIQLQSETMCVHGVDSLRCLARSESAYKLPRFAF